jgi:hypothetical protein
MSSALNWKEVRERICESSPSGRLYRAIGAVARNLELAEQVCQHFEITENMNYADEMRLSAELLDNYPLRKSVTQELTQAKDRIIEFLGLKDPGADPQRVVRAAVMLIGLWTTQQRSAAVKQADRIAPIPIAALAPQTQSRTASPQPSPQQPVVLTLVVPSRQLSSFAGELPFELPVEDVVRLVGEAIYFRAASQVETDQAEQGLGLENRSPARDQQQDVYLRLRVAPGAALLDADTPYALKKRLRDSQPAPRITLERRSILVRLGDSTFLRRV